MSYIFHIMAKNEWQKIKENKDAYKPDSLAQEGFIHCSKTDQILDVANHLFKGREHGELVILKIAEAKIQAPLKVEAPFEFPQSEITYPHIYGPLNIDAVEEEIPFCVGKDGNFHLPKLF